MALGALLGGALGLGIVLDLSVKGMARFKAANREFATLDAQSKAAVLNTQRRMKMLGGAFAGGAALAIGGAVGLAVALNFSKASSEFEYAMANVRGVTKATDEDFASLKSMALDVGTWRLSEYAPTEAAAMMYELASAGMEVGSIMTATMPALHYAAIAQIEVGDAAKLTTDAMKAFGMEASDMTHIVDAMVRSSQLSKIHLYELHHTFGPLGAAAGIANQTFEDTLAMLGGMVDAGASAAHGAQALKSSLIKMGTSGKPALKGLGVALADAEGKFRPFPDIIEDIQNRFKSLKTTEVEQVEIIKKIFGMRGGTEVWNMFTKASVELRGEVYKGVDAIRMLSSEYKSAEGTAEEYAEIMADTWEFTKRSIAAVWGVIKIVLGEGIQDVLRQIGQAFFPIIEGFSNWLRANPQLVKMLSYLLVFGSIFALVAGLVIMLVAGILAMVVAIAGGVWAIGSAGPVLAGVAIALGVALAVATWLAAVAGSIWGLWKSNFGNVREYVTGVWSDIKERATKVWEYIQAIAIETWVTIRDEFEKIKPQLVEAWAVIEEATEAAFAAIADAWEYVGPILESNIVTALKIVAAALWLSIKGFLKLIEIGAKIIVFFSKSEEHANAFKEAIAGVWNKFKEGLNRVWSLVQPFVDFTIGMFVILGFAIWKLFIEPAVKGFKIIWKVAKWVFGSIADFFGWVWGLTEKGLSMIVAYFKWVWGIVEEGFAKLKEWGAKYFMPFVDLFVKGWGFIKDAVVKAFDWFKAKLDEIKDHPALVAIAAAFKGVTEIGTAAREAVTGHQYGTSYIRQTGFKMLHVGESVLRSALNPEITGRPITLAPGGEAFEGAGAAGGGVTIQSMPITITGNDFGDDQGKFSDRKFVGTLVDEVVRRFNDELERHGG